MFRAPSSLPMAAAAVAAASVIAACGSNSPSSSSASSSEGPPTQAQVQQIVHFADCMRSHGVPNFPDPTTSPHEFKEALDPATARTPAFLSAGTACQHLMPRHSQSSQSAAPTRAQTAAMLAFARCIRSHGFPNFPDPSSTGDLNHQMVANAGINLHQPAVLQAGDACTSVTHGVITRSIVAHFVAGQ